MHSALSNFQTLYSGFFFFFFIAELEITISTSNFVTKQWVGLCELQSLQYLP